MLTQIHTMKKCVFFKSIVQSQIILFSVGSTYCLFSRIKKPLQNMFMLKDKLSLMRAFFPLNSCPNREGRQNEENTFFRQRPVMSDLVGPLSISLYLLYVDDFIFFLSKVQFINHSLVHDIRSSRYVRISRRLKRLNWCSYILIKVCDTQVPGEISYQTTKPMTLSEINMYFHGSFFRSGDSVVDNMLDYQSRQDRSPTFPVFNQGPVFV